MKEIDQYIRDGNIRYLLLKNRPKDAVNKVCGEYSVKESKDIYAVAVMISCYICDDHKLKEKYLDSGLDSLFDITEKELKRPFTF